MSADRHSRRAQNLRRFREALGLSQAELAAKSGVLLAALHELESGSCRIPIFTIDKIADAFGITSSTLLAALDCDGTLSMTADERVVSIVAYLHAVAAQQDEYARKSEGARCHPGDKPGPHAGFVYTKLLGQRAFMARALAKRIARGDDLIVLPKAKESTDA